MNLAKFTDYALRVCLYLAAREERIVPISELARAHRLPQSSLMKVVNQLVEGGFLTSTRGRSGGVRLSQPATATGVGVIVRHMEGDAQLVDCTTCILRGSCGLVGALRHAKETFYQMLDQTTLADALAGHPRTLAILLDADANARADAAGF